MQYKLGGIPQVSEYGTSSSPPTHPVDDITMLMAQSLPMPLSWRPRPRPPLQGPELLMGSERLGFGKWETTAPPPPTFPSLGKAQAPPPPPPSLGHRLSNFSQGDMKESIYGCVG